MSSPFTGLRLRMVEVRREQYPAVSQDGIAPRSIPMAFQVELSSVVLVASKSAGVVSSANSLQKVWPPRR